MITLRIFLRGWVWGYIKLWYWYARWRLTGKKPS